MKKDTKPKEKILEIKKHRSSFGYFSAIDMVKMFDEHGITMSRQTYSNKETGRSKFNVGEIQVLAEVFNMSLDEAIRFFNGW